VFYCEDPSELIVKSGSVELTADDAKLLSLVEEVPKKNNKYDWVRIAKLWNEWNKQFGSNKDGARDNIKLKKRHYLLTKRN
jgi:hypothetical protein